MEVSSNQRLEGDQGSCDQDDAATKKLGLFDLPQELQDIIFDYAYPENENLKLVSKMEWEYRELHSRMADQTHAIREYPAPKVNEMIISKRFFEAAIRTWLGNQWIEYETPYTLCSSSRRRGTLSTETLFCKWGSKVIWEGPACEDSVLEFVSMKRLKVLVSMDRFSAPGAGYAWEVLYSDNEIKATKAYKKIVKIRGLVGFEVQAAEDYHLRNVKSRLDVWHQNVKRLEELARTIVLGPKEPAADEDSELLSRLERIGAELGVSLPEDWIENGGQDLPPLSDMPDTDEAVLQALARSLSSRPKIGTRAPTGDNAMLHLRTIASCIKDMEPGKSVADITRRPRRIKRSSAALNPGSQPLDAEPSSPPPSPRELGREIMYFIDKLNTDLGSASRSLKEQEDRFCRQEKEMRQELEDMESVEEELEELREYAGKLEEEANRKQKILDIIYVWSIAALCFCLTMLVAPPYVQEKLWTL